LSAEGRFEVGGDRCGHLRHMSEKKTRRNDFSRTELEGEARLLSGKRGWVSTKKKEKWSADLAKPKKR